MAEQKKTRKRRPRTAPPTAADVPVQETTPYIDFGYCLKEGGNTLCRLDEDLRVYRTGQNELTFYHDGDEAKVQLDRLIAIVAKVNDLPVGKALS